MPKLITRKLGRTDRQVTTLGLGGQASIQWPGEDIDPVAIIEKAVRLGINYLDTSNIYGPSQKNLGEAFSKLKLVPGKKGYDSQLRKQIFLATKTHFRSARRPGKERFHSDYSEGMLDDFHVKNAVEDVKRSLSLLFGDGRGAYPEGAYLDSIQFHNLNTFDEVDMLFEGFDNPSPDRPWMGALAAMLDLREGTNKTGLNPKNEKLVRHIGITGHWNTAAHIYAIQRDEQRVIDTLLVTINPSDGQYLGHRYNAIPVAEEAGMGIIGMKVFADGAYFHKEPKFSGNPEDVYHQVGSKDISGKDLIQYSLSVQGVNTVIAGIGHIDDDPSKCQLERNLAAAQIKEPLSDPVMATIEESIQKADKHGANRYFQRPATGLTPPRNVGAEKDFSMPGLNRTGVRVTWNTAYAGNRPVDHYEVMRNGKIVGNIPHRPQYTRHPFYFDDHLNNVQMKSELEYRVFAVDTDGQSVASHKMRIG